MTDQAANHCPQCGVEMPGLSPDPLCSACLLKQALASRTIDPSSGSEPLSPPPSAEEIADKFPNYEVVECLGRGGMGVVYKARQKSLDRWVAIKVLAPERVHEERFAEHFEREAKILAKMSHPNIVTVFDHGVAEGLYYIVMEFIDGVNLRDLLSEGNMEPEQALAIVPPICEALEYAHDKGVVHRDIKPENVLLDRDGRVKIADFGIASLVGASEEHSGTPPYMAPEQSGGVVDRRADIYALGAVLYEMLTGERPGNDLVAPSNKVEIDVRIDEMVLRALEKEPERRYQTAGDFRTMVQTIATPRGEQEQEEKVYPFSRLALGAAAWLSLALLGLLILSGGEPPLSGLGWLALVVTLTAPIGVTFLGWTAVARIRSSEGKVRGLKLATFAGLLFPLLALNGLIYLLIWLFGAGLAVAGSLEVLLLGTPISLGADFWIVRRVWRAVKDLPQDSPLNPPAREPGKKLSWRSAAALALLLAFVTIGPRLVNDYLIRRSGAPIPEQLARQALAPHLEARSLRWETMRFEPNTVSPSGVIVSFTKLRRVGTFHEKALVEPLDGRLNLRTLDGQRWRATGVEGLAGMQFEFSLPGSSPAGPATAKVDSLVPPLQITGPAVGYPQELLRGWVEKRWKSEYPHETFEPLEWGEPQVVSPHDWVTIRCKYRYTSPWAGEKDGNPTIVERYITFSREGVFVRSDRVESGAITMATLAQPADPPAQNEGSAAEVESRGELSTAEAFIRSLKMNGLPGYIEGVIIAGLLILLVVFVRRAQPARRRALIVAGIGLTIWLLIFVASQFSKRGDQRSIAETQQSEEIPPHEFRKLPTDQLIAYAVAHPISPWAWKELEGRPLSDSDVGGIVSGLKEWLRLNQGSRLRQPLSWLNGFLDTLDERGMIRQEDAVDLMQLIHGPLRAEPRIRVREDDETVGVAVGVGNIWEKNRMELALMTELGEVTVDGKPVDARDDIADWSMDRRYLTVPIADLPLGSHSIQVVVKSALVPSEDLAGLDTRAPSSDWPPAIATWNRTADIDVEVFSKDAEIVGLVRDETLNPVRNKKLWIEGPIMIRRKGDGAEATLRFEYHEDLPLAFSFDVELQVGDQTVPCGSIWASPESEGKPGRSSVPLLSVDIGSLAPDLTEAEVLLTPNPRIVERHAEIETIYNGIVRLSGVELKRLDREGNLVRSDPDEGEATNMTARSGEGSEADRFNGNLNAGKGDEPEASSTGGTKDEKHAKNQTQRRRFVPKDGLEDRSNWAVLPKGSALHPEGWAILANLARGGEARPAKPGVKEPFMKIRLVDGNDDWLRVEITNIADNRKMMVSLKRDESATILVDGRGYRLLFPSQRVAADQEALTHLAPLMVFEEDERPADD